MIMGKAVEGMAARVGSVNIMAHGKLSSPTNQFVVRPSPDLAYSICPFDLTKGAGARGCGAGGRALFVAQHL
jgi:uncharacterized membrane protein